MITAQRASRRTPWPLLVAAPLLAHCGGSTNAVDTTKDAGADTFESTRDANGTSKDAASDATGSSDAIATADAPADDDAGNGVTAVPLTACIPGLYAAPITIGSQAFELWVDTGSTTLGVASSTCTTCGVSPEYTPGSTATDQKAMVTSQYESGSWTGEVYQDTVHAGSSPSAPLDFAAIDMQSSFFEPNVQCGGMAGGYQGLVGFGPPSSALTGTTGFFDALVANAHVPNVFATEFCPDGGTLWLGGYDATHTTAAPQYTPLSTGVVSQYYYAVDLETITVAGTSVTIPSGAYDDTVIDTGTSVFIVSPAAFTSITTAIGNDPAFAQIFGSGGDAGAASYFSSPSNCVSLGQTKAELDQALPAMTLVFGTNPAISVQVAPTESYLVSYEDLWCPTLYSMAAGPTFPLASILGSPVIRSNVVVFDRANSRIGFAPHTACP